MSVMLLSLNHYKMVFEKACTYPSKRITDIDYCHTLSRMNDKRIKHLIKDWYKMNILSYNYRYNTNVSDSVINSIDNWEYENVKDKPCSAYQMLKLLECIRYQIEQDSFSDKEREQYETSLQLLNRAINSIRDSIISQMNEYKEARWCIY